MFNAVNSSLKEAKDDGSATVPKPLPTAARDQILELIQILQPIAEATDELQSDRVTSSAVIPSIVGVYTCKSQL